LSGPYVLHVSTTAIFHTAKTYLFFLVSPAKPQCSQPPFPQLILPVTLFEFDMWHTKPPYFFLRVNLEFLPRVLFFFLSTPLIFLLPKYFLLVFALDFLFELLFLSFF